MSVTEITEKTRMSIAVVYVLLGLVASGVAAGSIFAYGVQRDIADIKKYMASSISRDELRVWTKDLKIGNPTLTVPEIKEASMLPASSSAFEIREGSFLSSK